MAKKKQQMKSTNTKAPKTNEKGEIISWDSNLKEGKALKSKFHVAEVKKGYPENHEEQSGGQERIDGTQNVLFLRRKGSEGRTYLHPTDVAWA